MKKIHALMIMSLLLLPSCKKRSDVSKNTSSTPIQSDSVIPEAPSDMEYPSDNLKMTDLESSHFYEKDFTDFNDMKTYMTTDFINKDTTRFYGLDLDDSEDSLHKAAYWLVKGNIYDGGSPEYYLQCEETSRADLPPMYRTDKFQNKPNTLIHSRMLPIYYDIDLSHTTIGATVSSDGKCSWFCDGILRIMPKGSDKNYASVVAAEFSGFVFNTSEEAAKKYFKNRILEKTIWMYS